MYNLSVTQCYRQHPSQLISLPFFLLRRHFCFPSISTLQSQLYCLCCGNEWMNRSQCWLQWLISVGYMLETVQMEEVQALVAVVRGQTSIFWVYREKSDKALDFRHSWRCTQILSKSLNIFLNQNNNNNLFFKEAIYLGKWTVFSVAGLRDWG